MTERETYHGSAMELHKRKALTAIFSFDRRVKVWRVLRFCLSRCY